MNNNPTITPQVVNSPFRNFCMSIGAIPTSYQDSLDYYETLLWLIKFLDETVIPAVSTNGNAVAELQSFYLQLQSYVNNYFDNLDVQEEINNKLDDMVEQGTLQEIIADYLNSKAVFGYDNVASMKTSTNLIDGSYARTLGFYTKNDGGGSLYKIREITNSDVVDEMTIISIGDDDLIAELILNDTINIKQLGARPQIENTKYDIKNYIDKYLEIQTTKNKKYNLYIPSGVWYTSGNILSHSKGFNIFGDECFAGWDNRALGTIISAYTNQDYIFRLGNSSTQTHNWCLKNIIFSTSQINYNNNNYFFDITNLKTVGKILDLHYAQYGITDNLFFYATKGNCLSINSSWENYFKLLNFRNVTNENGSIINFETADTTLTNYPNVTANNFEKIMFEGFHGNLINFESDCQVFNNHFGIINVEDISFNNENREYTTFNDTNLLTWDDSTATHYAIFNLETNAKFESNVIDSIELNNYSTKYYIYDSNKYTYDTIIKYDNNSVCNNIFNNIASNGMTKNCKIIYITDNITTVNTYTGFNSFNNFFTDGNKQFIFDVKGLNFVNVNENIYLNYIPGTYSGSGQYYDYLSAGGWIPCYKTMSKRFLTQGKGQLYYDDESKNNINLVVKPRLDNFDRALFITTVNHNKKLYIRAKVPDEKVGKINITNKSNNENIVATLDNGDGTYKIYSFDLTNTWNVGDIISITLAGANDDQRVMYLDSYISC